MSTSTYAYCASFFSNATSPTYIYTRSLHDALPILFTLIKYIEYSLSHFPTFPLAKIGEKKQHVPHDRLPSTEPKPTVLDRKSTRLNSSHLVISYAVFCLKKKRNRKSIKKIYT